jgi:hypothetical protein
MTAPPDIKIVGFALWVHGYEYPDATDAWDGNWLRVTAHAGANGAEVRVAGAILETVSVARFAKELQALGNDPTSHATLESPEPNLKVVVTPTDRLGHLSVSVEITPDHMTQDHRFEFEADQTFLAPIVRQCESILSRFPVRLPAKRGV